MARGKTVPCHDQFSPCAAFLRADFADSEFGRTVKEHVNGLTYVGTSGGAKAAKRKPCELAKHTQSKHPTPITQFKRPDRDHVARGWGPHRYMSITNPLPDNESTQKFPISSHITGRLMELKEHQIYTVEFLNPDGARVASDDLELLERRCDGSLASIPESRMFPSFRHLYFITPDDRVYEVHFGHRIVSTITFPRRAEVAVHGALASQTASICAAYS
ncbi:uncharacterized protein HD556DRAFT_1312919 [Suillus plorans]|uniref:Uncharacterized protein n=1 Tax=Suillus plorans TaxID=116603 RepID=A0A9P7ADM7_9AGAM|nr:uncharacterized protein HD556DRAFT_1312919 [Suillus plorans]KAG1787203.1 hypothetical protein HD556DRAFT_1312919 [Suillus plorans]